MDTRMTTQFIKDALTTALWRRGKPRNVHSDQGSQYRSMDYQLLLKEHEIDCSMSRKGNFHDNVMIESFLQPLKNELTIHTIIKNAKEAQQSILNIKN